MTDMTGVGGYDEFPDSTKYNYGRKPQRGPKPVSYRQAGLIENLLGERAFDLDAWLRKQDIPAMSSLTGGKYGTASKLITALFAADMTPEAEAARATTPKDFDVVPGTYVRGDDEVVVTISKQGQWYAKRNREYIGRRIDLTTYQLKEEVSA